jgi:hypothetical protein
MQYIKQIYTSLSEAKRAEGADFNPFFVTFPCGNDIRERANYGRNQNMISVGIKCDNNKNTHCKGIEY